MVGLTPLLWATECAGGKEWSQQGREPWERRGLRVEPETKAISVLMNETGHQRPAKEMEFCTYIELWHLQKQSEKLVVRPRMGRQTPNIGCYGW